MEEIIFNTEEDERKVLDSEIGEAKVEEDTVDENEVMEEASNDAETDCAAVDEPEELPSEEFGNKYPELAKSEAEPENDEDIVGKSGFFDIAAKIKNKKIEKAAETRRHLMSDLEIYKRNLRNSLFGAEKYARRVILHEQELADLEKSISEAGFFGAIKQTINQRQNKDEIKHHIKDAREILIMRNKDVKDYLEKLEKCDKELAKVTKELFELTHLERFADYKPVEGTGIDTAKTIAIKVKNTNPEDLKQLFGTE